MAKARSLILLLAIAGAAVGLHTGAPEAACGNMTPQHGFPAQTGNSPYRIIMSSTKSAGEPITISLVAPTSGPKFRGFFIQCRAVGGSEPVGQFNPASDSASAQPVTCNGKPNVAMTHKNNDDKDQVKLEWTPPSGNGQYQCMVTFVKQQDTFWVQQMPDSKIEVTAAAAAGADGRANQQQPNNPNSNSASAPAGANNEANNGSNSGGVNSNNASSHSQPPSEGGAASIMVPFWSAVSLSVACVMISFFRLHQSYSSLL